MLRNLFRILKYQFFFCLLVTAFVFLPSIRDSARQLSLYLWGGALVSALNFALLFWVWAIAFTKKKIAPLVFAVVSKYAILGLVLWGLSPLPTMPMAFFVFGVLSNSMALVLFGVRINK